MTSLFISHSSQDRETTDIVCARLIAEGFHAPFLDFDPIHGIPIGRNWERELYAQMRRIDGVVFLGSEASVSSPWCFTEIGIARSLGKPVFPIRLDAAARLPLLDDTQ